ncbi:nuclear transport factor 2 family protein [Arthrobacter sp. 260]|uniref:nuclear transport factor 2 family protein n=1 Tax=Arthrobacter sp. 260 TaxID=2735314 RepID=UPI001490F96B|nr:nuclear transport factor 2 family protein [Arthrobacter sp. 260]NOJ60013.1 nuclear transport factor 2 family protein [Arthrobacter sp. 260]
MTYLPASDSINDTETAQDQLPAAIRTYLDPSTGAAGISAFKDDAVVTDNGTHYAGREDLLRFLTTTTTEFEFTTTFLRAESHGDRHVVWNRLEGNFPGGTVDLKYTFNLEDGLIRTLDITA